MTVTVWVALRESCAVTLEVYVAEEAGTAIGSLILQGTSKTIALGKHLHVVAVTAKSIDRRTLVAGQLYAYNLTFRKPDGEEFRSVNNPSSGLSHRSSSRSSPSLSLGQQQNLQQALHSPLFPQIPISYFEHQLPTFALSPQSLNQLKIVHGSCRKPHGGGQDVLPILDDLIEHTAESPNQRPHQLFFTGDQIYGDDVADPLLFVLTDAGDALLGWEEHLPIAPSDQFNQTFLKPKQLKPGRRSTIAEAQGGFTAGLHDKPAFAKSHLFGLGEYLAAYLFAWSQVLWAEPLPCGWDIFGNDKQAKGWDREVRHLQTFIRTLWKVRRSLANIPTYMIFDDHDISDDWYLNQTWCLRVLGKPLGRRAIQNGLLAYTVCQGWGNTPEQFVVGQSGATLLQAAEQWSASEGTDATAATAIARYLGLPAPDPLTGLPQFRQDEQVWVLDHDPQALTWHYTIRSDRHEVIVLDTRTWRGYPSHAVPSAPPMLLSPTAFDRQIREPLQYTDQLKQVGLSQIEATIVVAPTNLVHLQAIDWAQHWSLKRGRVFDHDVGDAWTIHKAAFAELLTALFERRDRVMVLSGDIHYGCATALHYWSRDSSTSNSPPNQPHVLVQLTSSAFKNSELKTEIVHTKIKSLVPEPAEDWIGWNHTAELQEVQTVQSQVRWLKLPNPDQNPVVQRLSPPLGDLGIAWAIGTNPPPGFPDWRYHVEWIKRQPARTVTWGREITWLKPLQQKTPWLKHLGRGVKWLWQNRWLQEGNEVVGRNNFGLVRFVWSEQPDATKVVVQDLFWYAPWKPKAIVYSRFAASLDLEKPPTALLIPPEGNHHPNHHS